jgi:rhomboid protease GluP
VGQAAGAGYRGHLRRGAHGDHLHVAGITGSAQLVAGAYLPIFLRGGQFTVGASRRSSACCALVYYGRRGGSRMVGSEALSYALMLGVFGFIMPGVDNYAHAGGFGGGYLAARLLDPLKPERIDHVVIALACLAASILSIAVSVLHGLQFF